MATYVKYLRLLLWSRRACGTPNRFRRNLLRIFLGLAEAAQLG
jgi:hypothetical protein